MHSWETASASPCRPPSGAQGAAGKTLQHDPPLSFDLEADPSESSPVLLAERAYADVTTALDTLMADIQSTMQSEPEYAQGGWDAAPCCNRN